jgi:serine protease Do
VASGALGATLIEGRSPALAQAPITVTPSQALPSFADVVDKVKPAVVSVRVKIANVADTAEDSAPSGRGLENVPPQLREFFRRFGEGQPGERGPRQGRPGGARQSQGSGFFISADGYAVTNNHVVQNAASVTLVTDDGRSIDAKVVGTDPKTDLALLKVNEGGTYPYVRIAGKAPRVGDWVVAIGNPFGLGGTVTSGIVSARGRDIGAGPYDDFLQIDAPINKGNSGGPTFNLLGEVVGVNTAIFSPSGGSVGLAFAIPADTVQTVVDQLGKEGQVTRGYLGVQVQPLTRDIADGLGLKEDKGALVGSAQADTPAAKAGLKAGDVITAVNGEPVANARELTRKVGGLRPGSKAEVRYLRDGREQTATVELATLPGEKSAKVERDTDRANPRLGLQLGPTQGGEEGVAITSVDPNGPAATKGLQAGEVILEVGGQAVSNPSDVKAGVEAAQKAGRKAVLMRIKGREGTRFVAVALPNAG